MPLDAARAEAIRQVHVRVPLGARRARRPRAPARRSWPPTRGRASVPAPDRDPTPPRPSWRCRGPSGSRRPTRCVDAVERVLGSGSAVVPVSDRRAQRPAASAERAVLVGVDRPREPAFRSPSRSRSCARLADTAGLEVGGRGQSRRSGASIRPRSSAAARSRRCTPWSAPTAADVVVFDDPLSPAQQRNLEKALGCKVIDRSALILDIFAQRARTPRGQAAGRAGAAPVPAAAPHPRSGPTCRALGGGVGTRGPGETQLEVDRRRVRERIAHAAPPARTTSSGRARCIAPSARPTPFPTVALVGYTNAGKSTLMNALTRAGVLVEDRLFATLDPTVRRLRLPERPDGRCSPTRSASSTSCRTSSSRRSRARSRRCARPTSCCTWSTRRTRRWQEHARVVDEVLAEIGADERAACISVLNKIDLLDRTTRPRRRSTPRRSACRPRRGRASTALLHAHRAAVSTRASSACAASSRRAAATSSRCSVAPGASSRSTTATASSP